MSRYHRLNLRCNPFERLEPDELIEVAIPQFPLEPLIEQIQAGGVAVQFIGRSGHGKSTHLALLHQHFPDAPYLKFNARQSHPSIPNAPVLFLDETQRLPFFRRDRIWRRAQSLVIGTHWPHQFSLRRAGFRPITHHVRGLDADAVQQMAMRRIERARLDDGRESVGISAEFAHQLTRQYRGNVEAIVDALYDHFYDRAYAHERA